MECPLRYRIMIAAAALVLATPLQAHEFQVGSIFVDHPWSRPTPPNAAVASGYIKLKNNGAEVDRLVNITSPIASSVEVHRSIVEDDVAKMRPVEDLTIEPGKEIDFGAERLHLMFNDPNRQLKDKDKFPATLTFETAGKVDVEFVVQRTPGEATTEDHSGHGK